MENLRGEHSRMLEEAKKEKVSKCLFLKLLLLLLLSYVKHFPHVCFCFLYQLLLTNQLEMEKMKVEQEKKKCYLAQEALKDKVLKIYENRLSS